MGLELLEVTPKYLSFRECYLGLCVFISLTDIVGL